MSLEKRAYSTACVISHRPPYRTQPPVFYRCEVCGSVNVKLCPSQAPSSDVCCVCCGRPMQMLTCSAEPSPASDGHELDYTVFGGFQHNTVRIDVENGTHPMTAEHHIAWIYLRTYQGGQIKYLPLKRPSTALFCLAEEDAYVYCDRAVCRMGWENCQFQCKRGHIAYAYCSLHGLHQLTF